jgi:hypothetical protein
MVGKMPTDEAGSACDQDLGHLCSFLRACGRVYDNGQLSWYGEGYRQTRAADTFVAMRGCRSARRSQLPSTRQESHGMPPSTATQRPDLVLHIGSGKTGTSSIQVLMHRNRDRLAKLGVLYPRTPGNVRHVRLGLFIRSDTELERQVSWRKQDLPSAAAFREEFERDLLAEFNDSRLPQALMSDEALYGSSHKSLTRLRSLTDKISASLRVVVYLRRQDDHMVSRYQQVVKIGETRRLAERTRQLDLSSTYDYYARLRAWRRLVEPTSIVVRRFERDSFVDGSLHQDFLDAAGIAARADDWEPVGMRNESLDAETVEFLRILNLYLVEHEGARAGVISHRKLVARLAQSSTGPTLTLPESVLDEFMDTWEKSNTAVAREFLGDARRPLFLAPRKTGNTTTEQHLDPARLDHFLALTELPEHMHAPLRSLVDQEASTR